jgi:hypothetical protein
MAPKATAGFDENGLHEVFTSTTLASERRTVGGPSGLGFSVSSLRADPQTGQARSPLNSPYASSCKGMGDPHPMQWIAIITDLPRTSSKVSSFEKEGPLVRDPTMFTNLQQHVPCQPPQSLSTKF